MTEAEWLAADNRYVLLRCPALRPTDRKLRLFAAACCRRLGSELVTARYRRIIDTVEEFADGLMSPEKFQAGFPRMRLRVPEGRTARDVAREAILAMNWVRDETTQRLWDDWECAAVESDWGPGRYAEHYTTETCGRVAHALAYHAIGSPGPPTPAELASRYGVVSHFETARLVGLFRDIFGNPFRPITFLPEWRTQTVLALAQQMYDTRDFSAMPILGDALMDAGCFDEVIQNHCRGPEPHTRGCWVTDACLGKS